MRVVLLALSLALGCKEKAVNIPAPKPIRPGLVDIVATGALALEVRGVGGSCEDFGGERTFSASSSDIQGPATRPEWLLFIRTGGKGPQLISFTHGPGDEQVRFQVEPTGASLRIDAQRAVFDAELRSDEGGVVRLTGTVECEQRATKNEIPPAAIDLLASITGEEVRRHSTIDFGREEYPGAISAIVPKEEVQDHVAALRKRLGPGWVAFEGINRSLAENPPDGVELIVAPGETQLDILRIAKSDAVNYGMETEALIKKLKQYDEKYRIDIFHAETDTIEFRIGVKQFDAAALAKDLYEFCPDIVDQGVGDVNALAEELRRTHSVFLWWD